MRRLFGWLWRYRWVLALFAGAFAIRLWWNHLVHQPQEFVFSDMASYVARAQRLVDAPFGTFADEPFYPFGTHYLLAACMLFWGKTNLVAAATYFALLSALLSPIAYLLAGRLHGGPEWSAEVHAPRVGGAPPERDEQMEMASAVARVAGMFIAIYYPLLSYTGYFLSEIPFALFLSLSVWLSLRMVDHGRVRDAVWLGIAVAIGAAVRPQLLVGFAMAALLVLWRRKSFPLVRVRHGLVIAIPIALVIGFSLLHSHHHTGRYSVLAQNGALNRAFGRCHNIEMRASNAMFGPPAFGALLRAEKRDPDIWIKLAPALGPKLRVKGFMWDEDELNALAQRCIEATGVPRQLYYALTHVVLLWGYHVAWPDMGQTPYRFYMRGWTRAHLLVFVLPALVALAMGANRRWPRHGVVGMYLWSMLLTVALVMGSARLRVPYDLIAIVLALDVYARLATRLTAWRRGRRAAAA
jgi:hypothetical protein